jgi:hypothetical protein
LPSMRFILVLSRVRQTVMAPEWRNQCVCWKYKKHRDGERRTRLIGFQPPRQWPGCAQCVRTDRLMPRRNSRAKVSITSDRLRRSIIVPTIQVVAQARYGFLLCGCFSLSPCRIAGQTAGLCQPQEVLAHPPAIPSGLYEECIPVRVVCSFQGAPRRFLSPHPIGHSNAIFQGSRKNFFKFSIPACIER